MCYAHFFHYVDEPDMAKDATGGDGDHVDPKMIRKWGWLFVEAIALVESMVILWKTTISMTSTMMQWCQLMAQTWKFPSTSHSGRAGSATR